MENKPHKSFRQWLPYIIPALFVMAYICINRLLLGSFTVCPFRAFTGYPCPGCGLTHAGTALLRLDIKSSFAFHALFIPVLCTLIIFIFPKGILKAVDWAKHQYWWYALLVVAMLAYYGYRMHYCFPGKYPMHRNHSYYFGKVDIKERLPAIKKNIAKRLNK